MVTLYIKITVAIMKLLVLRCANAEGGIRFTYTHGSRDNKFEILSINRNYFIYKRPSSKYPPQKDEVNCSFFIPFDGQEGIDICHDEDYEHYLVYSKGVQSQYVTENEPLYVECGSMQDIIERKETTIQCTVRKTDNSKQQKVTIGWIQGDNSTTQTFNLAEGSKSFNQTFKGFHSGDGIFFYCFSIPYTYSWYLYNRCYTFRLTVYPEITVEIQRLHESPEFLDNRYCFRCYVGLTTDEKSYKWNLNGEEMTDLDQHQEERICFNQSTLQAGKNNVECTVILNMGDQKRSGTMEFSLTTHVRKKTQVTTSPKQNNQSAPMQNNQLNKCVEKNLKIAFITMAVTTIIFGFIILFLLYKPKDKHGNHPQQAVHYQRNTAASLQERSDIPQNGADEQDYYSTIKDNTENVYVITESDMMTETNKYTEEEIMSDPEIPYYFVLESQ